jgi:putative flippase GtrA
MATRWLRFSAVGAGGILVQTVVLSVLVRKTSVHYLIATVMAVESAIIHNFIWHRSWTWADRLGKTYARQWWAPLLMLARFNLTSGLVSMAGNLLFMNALVAAAGIGIVRANLAAIALCWVTNFFLADRFVFK